MADREAQHPRVRAYLGGHLGEHAGGTGVSLVLQLGHLSVLPRS